MPLLTDKGELEGAVFYHHMVGEAWSVTGWQQGEGNNRIFVIEIEDVGHLELPQKTVDNMFKAVVQSPGV